jgi:GxGYxYP putative glycoside hydrolase C-terminal domain/GxGYxYP_N second domain/GxGYxYP third domain/GxGYxYP_N 1st domain
MKYGNSILVRTFTYSLLVAAGLLLARGPAWAKVEEKTIHCSVMNVEGNWNTYGDLPNQALLISLQGLVNRTGPRLYLLYGPKYAWTEVQALLDFYHEKRHVDYTKIDSIPEALQKFRKYVKGYIVYDQKIRDSIVLSFTAAGVMDGVVVAESQIPMMEKLGFKKLADFRGKFEGMTSTQIYKWAYKQYWNKCTHKMLVYMGGVEGESMQPGIADLGIASKAFFYDLCTKTTCGEEYDFVSFLYSRMKPFSMLFGWHSYSKDYEHTYVTLASHYALRVEGLNTLPNMSFHRFIKASAGFKFKTNHSNLKNLKVEKKIYIALIQSDGLGIGAWLKPGRGSVPYAWEVNMYLYNYAPAILQYYYEQATPNDYFIGALGGPSYMYPKAIPTKYIPKTIEMAGQLMKDLDLNVFEIFDASDSLTRDLPPRVVNAYFKYMPGAVGFVNGYGPAHTFAAKNGRAFVSFDYYLAPTRTVDEAVGDLKELATLNPKRPYFLCFHVRESNDIKRVKEIIDKMGSDCELVPIDKFLKLAAMAPTFKTQYQFTR